MPVDIVHALAQVKRAAAEVNGDLGLLAAALETGGVSAAEYDAWVDMRRMSIPG